MSQSLSDTQQDTGCKVPLCGEMLGQSCYNRPTFLPTFFMLSANLFDMAKTDPGVFSQLVQFVRDQTTEIRPLKMHDLGPLPAEDKLQD